MRSTPRRTTLLRLVLGAAALAFGWLLLSMTPASADDGSTPLASVVTLAKDTPLPKTADVVEPVQAVTKSVEKVAATEPLAPVLSAPVAGAAAVVRASTTAVSEDVDTAVSEAVGQVAAVAGTALAAAPAVPTVPVVPGSTTTGTSPSTTATVTVVVEDAVSLGHAARELASVARTAGPAPQQTAATALPSVRSGPRAMVPEPVSPGLLIPGAPGAPGAMTLPGPITATGGGPHTVDAAALTSAAVSARTTPLRAEGALLHPVPGPVSDPGSRPD